MQKRQGGVFGGGELSLSQGHLTPLSIFNPMFYLEAILPHLLPHYGSHSATDVRGRRLIDKPEYGWSSGLGAEQSVSPVS